VLDRVVKSLDPGVIGRELGRLADDLGRMVPRLGADLRGAALPDAERVVIVGNGDSLFAGMSAAYAFRSLAGVAAAVMTPLELITYPACAGPTTLVVGVSASGNTPGCVEAVREARARGARTLALTTNPGSALQEAAEQAVVSELPDRQPSPGIRSYQATLLGLVVLAVVLGSRRGVGSEALAGELALLPAALERTLAALRPAAEAIAARIDPAAAWGFAGAGPNLGTAHYCAAKVVECLGRPAAAVAVDEWWHVDRHLLPPVPPLFIVGAPGPSRGGALELAARASAAGRVVYAAAAAHDHELARHVHGVLPVHGEVREELSPLLFHLFGSLLPGRVAELHHLRLFPARDLGAPTPAPAPGPEAP
jgi:glucosamine--fructose-6-phosphate aminotransferase (isomerizing)